MSNDSNFFEELESLKNEHQELDKFIDNSDNQSDEVSIQRFKKRRLWLKDRILKLEEILKSIS